MRMGHLGPRSGAPVDSGRPSPNCRTLSGLETGEFLRFPGVLRLARLLVIRSAKECVDSGVNICGKSILLENTRESEASAALLAFSLAPASVKFRRPAPAGKAVCRRGLLKS